MTDDSVINDVKDDTDTSLVNTKVDTKVDTAVDTTDDKAGETDTKTEDSKTDKDKVDGAPENYTDFSLPDGVELDTDLMSRFGDIAKTLNLTQEQAQELVDLQTSSLGDYAKDQTKAWDTLKEEWATAAKTDKEFGGAAFNENLATARKAVDQFGTPELKEMFDITGTGNHPEVLRFLWKIGKAISEDSIRVGSANNTVDAASLIYTSHNK